MNEKEKTEIVSRARSIQQGESAEIGEIQKDLAEACTEEANLFTARGYGGYIHSGEIKALRETQIEAAQRIISLSSRGAQLRTVAARTVDS